MWTRPVLCRICECPASDGGVRVDQLDAAKLSEWWLCKIGTDFLPEESEIEEIICNFCIWDARLFFSLSTAIAYTYLIINRVTVSGWSTNILRMNPTCLLVSTGGQATIPISFSANTIITV
jgi:hypothetical protein